MDIKCLILIFVTVFATTLGKNLRNFGHRYLETNEIEDATCLHLMESVYTEQVIAPNPPNLSGEWTSARCEIRPGPEFLLRRYIFLDKLQFELHQYYYRDSSCTDPAYSVVAKGQLRIGEESWLVPGGLENQYELSLVTIMPYTNHVAKKLQENFGRTCPQMVRDNWKPLKSYVLYQFLLDHTDDYYDDPDVLIDHDCKASLNLVFHELQLLRMEVHKRHNLELRKMLYLGDVHTDYTQRESYRPTSYQDPLYFSQTPGCPVCTRILNSERYQPPILYYKAPPTASLGGEWFSNRCEVRPVGQFLTRHFLFSDDGKSWEGYFHYFSDQKCLHPMFTVHAAGSYIIGQSSDDVEGAFKFDVQVERMRVTPRDMRIVDLLNEDMGEEVCGTAGTWERGKQQEVTQTGGCAMLGLKVPVMAYELIKLEKDHHRTLLFLGQGQTVSDNTDNVGEQMRSTSFQTSLVRCGTVQSTRNAFDSFDLDLPMENEGHISVNIQAQVAPAPQSNAPVLLSQSFALLFISYIVIMLL